MENVTVPPDVLASFVKFGNNVRFLKENYRLLQDHIGKYVAVGDGQILGFSEKRDILLDKYSNVEGLFIEFITPSNIAWIL